MEAKRESADQPEEPQVQQFPVEISLYIIAEELSKIRQLMEMDFKNKAQEANKYAGMMNKFFNQQQQQ